MFRQWALIVAGLACGACQSLAGDYDRPARIVNADAGSRAALRAAVNEALGVEVILADTALTASSLLTIEHWPAGSIDNPVPQGRIEDAPVHFRLVKNGDDCVLVRQADGTRYPLADTECAVE